MPPASHLAILLLVLLVSLTRATLVPQAEYPSHPNCLASAILPAHEMAIVKRGWSYDGKTGPLKWGSLDPNYTMCSSGHRQSPVNFEMTDTRTPTLPLEIHYPEFFDEVTVENLGYTVELFAPQKRAWIVRDNVTYYLVQFHVHIPAE
ncbi:hypothetical protein HDU93_002351, partial [Gonapodya sp. JEL0774]